MCDDKPTARHERTPLGKAIDVWLAENNQTKVELGKAVGVTAAYLSHVCRGRNTPSSALLVRLAEFTGLDAIVLHQLEGIMPPEIYNYVVDNLPRFIEMFESELAEASERYKTTYSSIPSTSNH